MSQFRRPFEPRSRPWPAERERSGSINHFEHDHLRLLVGLLEDAVLERDFGKHREISEEIQELLDVLVYNHRHRQAFLNRRYLGHNPLVSAQEQRKGLRRV